MINERGTVAVVGLSYVGLPVAVLAKEKGWHVIGYDIDEKKVSLIQQGLPPFEDSALASALQKHPIEATTDPTVLTKAEVVLVAVQTPVDEHAHPDLHPLTSAMQTVATHAAREALLILESTVNPGVSEEIVAPLLKSSGRDVENGDLFLVHCPERVNPGDRKWIVRNIPRVLGGYTPEATDRGVAFYESILEAPVRRMSSLRAAEAVKITENTFRDINIAFVNELAQSFDVLGIDVQEVIAGAATKPFAFMAHYPGCGVGGHCIPVDPYYLIERAQQEGFEHAFLKLARRINNSMPRYTVDRLIQARRELAGGTKLVPGDQPLKGMRVTLLGLAYKRDVDDLRESPALEIENILREEGADLCIFDPFVPTRSTVSSLAESLRDADAVVLATDHSVFRTLTPKQLEGTPVRIVIDGRNCLAMETFSGSSILYRGIGRAFVQTTVSAQTTVSS